MILDSLLAGVMLFSSFAARTPNVQPNTDDYEISVGISNNNFHLNRQWERELGEFYIDDLFWLKIDNGVYFKPEYMNKESQGVKYLNSENWLLLEKNGTIKKTIEFNDCSELISDGYKPINDLGLKLDIFPFVNFLIGILSFCFPFVLSRSLKKE